MSSHFFSQQKKSLNVKYKMLRETELEHTKKIFTYNLHNFTTQMKKKFGY